MTPQVSIIIVNWNVRDALKANLARLYSLSDEVSREVFVVDNASSDGSSRMIREEFPSVRLIQNDWNAGFAYACNQAIRNASGDVILFLNPDMLVGEGALDRTYEELARNKDIGLLGCKLKREGEYVKSVRRDPTFKDQLSILTKVPHLMKSSSAVSRYLMDDMDYGRTQDVEQIRGAYMAFRRDILDIVGTMDERFFLWFEDVDYCKRVREAGYKVRYLADISCIDYVGQSFKQVSVAKKQVMLSRSMVSYFKKWHPWWQTGVLAAVSPLAIAGGWIYDVARKVKS